MIIFIFVVFAGTKEAKEKQLEKLRSFSRRVWMPVSRRLMYTWSDEELVLVTGNIGVTHLRHKLKLCSAYLGGPGEPQSKRWSWTAPGNITQLQGYENCRLYLVD
ncbi:carbon catabolite repressor protein 4 homolog 5-like [Durio zibethinus]|uniref:Carbon catabolite repressor protein 4 homolog 5-like n=1 Tax=Durio zibethinus TaxID=66656 RepID=A0A6P6BC14_DURZI|nr:carbon catabolite repressor protein 4 homolog 5-like [Durio zibethinus]XP_022774758.1 carbon catabolite repressor protein 4 homolog 5-like [Durio zibethinus]